jgi:hypothetical protein
MMGQEAARSSTASGTSSIEVLDADSNVIGSTQFGLAINSAGTSDGVGPVPVRIDGAASGARGYCGPGEVIEPGATYAFDDLEITTDPSPRLLGNISWVKGTYPGEQQCIAALSLPDESEYIVDFTLYVPEGHGVVTLLPEGTKGATVSSIECTPFDG